EQIAAVEQVEDLSDRNSVHRDRSGDRFRRAVRFHPEERPQGVSKERQADQDDTPDAEAGDDRAVYRARGPLHHVDFVRLEGNHQAERDGVTILTQRTCGAVIGMGKPTKIATAMTKACATLVGSMNSIAFSMLL